MKHMLTLVLHFSINFQNKSIIMNFKIETIVTEACCRLIQYGKGQVINCQCSKCKGKTDAEMRLSLDKIYKSEPCKQ